MGRRKIELTPEQIAERKQRWWGPEHNARRREKYSSDPEYRHKTIQGVRARYLKDRESQGAEVRRDNCLDNLAALPTLGQIRELKNHEGGTTLALTFTKEEMAAALSRHPQVFYRWLQADLLPAPAHEARNPRNRWQAIYTEPEVQAVLQVFGAHQQVSQYYRVHHSDTRTRMFDAVMAARTSFTS